MAARHSRLADAITTWKSRVRHRFNSRSVTSRLPPLCALQQPAERVRCCESEKCLTTERYRGVLKRHRLCRALFVGTKRELEAIEARRLAGERGAGFSGVRRLAAPELAFDIETISP
jgi:hypothetical protein